MHDILIQMGDDDSADPGRAELVVYCSHRMRSEKQSASAPSSAAAADTVQSPAEQLNGRAVQQGVAHRPRSHHQPDRLTGQQKTAPTTTTVTSDRMRARWKGTHFRVRVSTTTATLS